MNNELPTAILFDLDDTILSHGLPQALFLPVARRNIGGLSGISLGELLGAFEESRTWFWGDKDRHLNGRLDHRYARKAIAARIAENMSTAKSDLRVIERIVLEYGEARRDNLKPFDGAIDTLETLSKMGLLLALVTNGSAQEQRHKIERFGLGRWFNHIQIEGEFGLGKPEPAVYEDVLAKLGVRPQEAWMVGDNLEWDVAAPQRLGILGIWMDPYESGLPAFEQHVPARIIHRIAELVP